MNESYESSKAREDDKVNVKYQGQELISILHERLWYEVGSEPGSNEERGRTKMDKKARTHGRRFVEKIILSFLTFTPMQNWH